MEAHSSSLHSGSPFGGLAPPASLKAMLRAAQPETLYSEDEGGSYAEVMQELRDTLMALQKNALSLAAPETEARRVQLLKALLAVTDTVAQRVQILGQLGDFRFRSSVPADVRKERLTAVLGDIEEVDLAAHAAALEEVWRPEKRSFLDALIHRPSEAARMLSPRPSPTIIGHPLAGLGEEGRQAFIMAGVVSWREGRAIHLAGGTGDYLRAHTQTGVATTSACSPLHLLLLHEEVADFLCQSKQLAATARQVVAATFVACLSPVALPLAVESFFVEWESRQASSPTTAASATTASTDATTEDSDEEQWMECIITHDDLRPEAFVERTHAEQREILREMFGDDWDEEDEAALEAA